MRYEALPLAEAQCGELLLGYHTATAHFSYPPTHHRVFFCFLLFFFSSRPPLYFPDGYVSRPSTYCRPPPPFDAGKRALVFTLSPPHLSQTTSLPTYHLPNREIHHPILQHCAVIAFPIN